MVNKNENIICAVSGGADSMAMLIFFLSIKEEYNLNLSVCHVNHLLRGEESFRDERFVQDFCDKNNIQFYLLREDIEQKAKQHKLTVEECGRETRYNFFNKCAKDNNAKIATAHNLNDYTETIIFNMIRGTGIHGLCGIQPIRDNIIRPLIECERSEIEQYLTENNCNHIEDSTNAQTKYTRNRIRHDIIPIFNKINNNFIKNIFNMSNQLKDINNYIEFQALELMQKSKTDTFYNLEILSTQHSAVLNKFIWLLLKEKSISMNSKIIEDISNIIYNQNGKINIKNNLFAWIDNKCFFLDYVDKSQKKEKILYVKNVYLGYNYISENKILNLRLFKKSEFEEIFSTPDFDKSLNLIENLKNVHLSLLKNCIDYDKIGENLYVRNRLPHDVFRPAGRNISKSVKKIMNESKISIDERDNKFILCYNEEIVWIDGIGVSQSACCTETTENILLIEIIDNI